MSHPYVVEATEPGMVVIACRPENQVFDEEVFINVVDGCQISSIGETEKLKEQERDRVDEPAVFCTACHCSEFLSSQ